MFKLKHVVIGLCFCSAPASADDLLAVYQQALQSDPQLKSAGLKVDVGNAQTGQALGQLLPQIVGTANWSSNKLSTEGQRSRDYSGTRYNVSLTQSLIDFSKFWEWRRAKKAEDQYASELIDAQHMLIFNVTQRYFAVLDAEDQLELTQLEKQATKTELQQIEKRFAKQLAKITDVYEIEARLDQLAADEIAAESSLITAKQSLNELTNMGGVKLDKLRDNIVYQELEGKLEDWIAVAKSQNPVIAAQESAIQAASDNLAAQKSKHLPVVDLQLNYYDTDNGYQSVQTSPTQTQVAAINVSVPIFSGGTTTQQMYEAQSRLALTNEELEAKTRALIKETSDAFSTSNANARRIKAAERALTSASKSREAMQTGLKYGVETVADLLRAQQVEYKAKRELARAKYDYIINRVRFLKEIGSVNEENLQEINSWLNTAGKTPAS